MPEPLVQDSCVACLGMQQGGYQAWGKVVEHLDWVRRASGEHEHYTNVRSCNGCINVDSCSRQQWRCGPLKSAMVSRTGLISTRVKVVLDVGKSFKGPFKGRSCVVEMLFSLLLSVTCLKEFSWRLVR